MDNFASQATQVATQTGDTANATAQALFTQEQLNSIISQRINPLNQRLQDLSTQLAQSQQLANSYLSELNSFKQRDIVTKSGVSDMFVDFVMFEANKLAVNGKSFEEAVKEYTTSNSALFTTPQMTSQPQVVDTPSATQATQSNVGSAQTSQELQQNGQIGSDIQSGQSAQSSGVVTPTQVGGTSTQAGVNPASVNNIDSDVNAFLRQRGLIK